MECTKDNVMYDEKTKRLLSYPSDRTDECYVVKKGTKSIGPSAFIHNKYLKKVILPPTINEICKRAFQYSNIEQITIKTPKTKANGKPYTLRISLDAFRECKNLKKVNISSGLIDLGLYVFDGDTSLTSVKLDGVIHELPPYAFAHCHSLKSIAFSDGLSEVGSYAFNECRSLAKVVFPSSLKYIKGSAFANTRKLKGITFLGESSEYFANVQVAFCRLNYRNNLEYVQCSDSKILIPYDSPLDYYIV